MRLIHTSDWHFGTGYDPKKWRQFADRRRKEREGAVFQILSHAQKVKADFLVVAGDVCDFPETMPAAIRAALEDWKN